MKYFRRIEGSEVFLSPVNPQDVEIYTKWLNQPEIVRLVGTQGIISLPSEKDFLEKMAREDHNFAIVRQSDERLLGNCSLMDVNQRHRTATAGLFLGDPETMSRGYGSQALALLLQYAFDEVNLHNVMLNVYEYNPRAIRAYEKVGFQLIGRRRQCRYDRGEVYDVVKMDILPQELNRDLIGKRGFRLPDPEGGSPEKGGK